MNPKEPPNEGRKPSSAPLGTGSEAASGAPSRAAPRVASEAPSGDPWLLTPGPLTTSPGVKRAMQRDLGSRDGRFIAVNRLIRERLTALVHGQATHTCVPLQGSGTFVVEAMIGTFVPPGRKLAILVNGAYGRRMAEICRYLGREYVLLEGPEDRPNDVARLAQLLSEDGDGAISHVAIVHCETTTGLLNPLEEVAEVVARHGRGLLVDAMSTFGALAIDARTVAFDALVASSNKCLEATPGVGFCLARTRALEAAAGNAHSLALDLHAQWQAMERNGQWRFTPPVHTLLSLDQALAELAAEGGVEGRNRRYAENCRTLIAGMDRLGFMRLIEDAFQAPIIVTFLKPADPAFVFEDFYDRLAAKGFVIYPGKLTMAETFRIGCIGRLGKTEMQSALAAIEDTLGEMGVADCAPAPRPA